MKRFLLVAPLLVAGCLDRHVIINRYYTRDGFLVKGIHGRFEHVESSHMDSLTTGEGFQERVYKDTDHDGKPDVVTYRDETYRRDEPGTKEMFEEADRDFERAVKKYDIAKIEKDWAAMTPDERAERADYFK